MLRDSKSSCHVYQCINKSQLQKYAYYFTLRQIYINMFVNFNQYMYSTLLQQPFLTAKNMIRLKQWFEVTFQSLYHHDFCIILLHCYFAHWQYTQTFLPFSNKRKCYPFPSMCTPMKRFDPILYMKIQCSNSNNKNNDIFRSYITQYWMNSI